MSLFSPDQTAVAALLAFRLTGLLWTAPLFSAAMIPQQVKVVLLALLTILLFPVAGTFATPGLEVTALTLIGELTVGIMLGLGAAIFTAAAEAAGDLVAIQMGLSGASVMNPTSRQQLPVLGQFMGLFVLTLILSVGGHLVVLGALTRSLEIAPLGSPLEMAAGADAIVMLGGMLFTLGVQFAAPMIGANLIANAALGITARTVPQLNVLMVAFPVQIAVGLFTLAATLPMIAQFFTGFNGMYESVAADLLQSLVPAEGGVR